MSTFDAQGNKHAGHGKPDGGRFETQGRAEVEAVLTPAPDVRPLTADDLPDGLEWYEEPGTSRGELCDRDGDYLGWINEDEDGWRWSVAGPDGEHVAGPARSREDATHRLVEQVLVGVSSAPQSLEDWPRVVVEATPQALDRWGDRTIDLDEPVEVDVTEIFAAATPQERVKLLDGNDDGQELMARAYNRGLFDHAGTSEVDTLEARRNLIGFNPWVLEGPVCEVPAVPLEQTPGYRQARTALIDLDDDARAALLTELGLLPTTSRGA